MTPSNKSDDSHFSTFVVGVLLGAAAVLLFGTDEGKKLVKKALESVPDKYKITPDIFSDNSPKETPVPTPVIPLQETPHHTTYDYDNPQHFSPDHFSNEAPPPPPPIVHPFRPQ